MNIHIKKIVLGGIAGFLIFLIAIPALYWLLSNALDKALDLRPISNLAVTLIFAATSILIGMFWISWSYSYLVFVGKGLPFEAFGRAIQPTSELVTTGPYAYTRNPMIFGELFILLGTAFLARSVSGIILVPIFAMVIYLYLVEYEEKGLYRRFGADYEEYRRNVPAIFPQLKPYIHEKANA